MTERVIKLITDGQASASSPFNANRYVAPWAPRKNCSGSR